MSVIKQELIKKCESLLLERISELKNAEDSAKESAASETKSSAGDKHETARELIHQERELVSKQKMDAQNLLAELLSINPSVNKALVVKGSLIETSIGYFFLGISLGFVIINDVRVACISIASPLGSNLLGKKLNEQFNFQEKTIKILDIN
jgi:transcription elongation GreA/GreB family factor